MLAAARRGLTIATILVVGLATAGAFAAEVDLEIPGAGDDLRGKVRRALLSHELIQTDEPTAQDLLAAAQADYRRILTVLYDEGYFGATVSILVDGREAAQLSPVAGPDTVNSIVYRVAPNRRFTFGQAAIGPLAPGTAPPDGFRAGAIARTQRIQRAIDTSVTDWREIGFAKARIARDSVVADHAARELDVAIAVDPGPRLRFGRLLVTGNEAVRTERIRAIAGLPSGRIFHPEEVERATRRLRRTETFAAVALREAETPNRNDTLDIAATVQEAPPRRIGFGAELSSVEGATLSAYWLHRNLLGGAERFRIEGELSGIDGGAEGIDYRLRAEFRRPGTPVPDSNLLMHFELERLEEPQFSSDSAEFVVGLDRILTDRLEVYGGAGFRYADVRTAFGRASYTHFILPLSAEHDRRDDELNATSGYYLAGTALPFAALGGGTSGLRLSTDMRAYRAFGADDRVVLAGRLQLGSVLGPDLREALPQDLFFSGGGGTVRGQDYQSLGISVPSSSDLSGGRSFVGVSAELRTRVTDNISVVGFYDHWTIGRDAFPDADSPSHAGAGLGLRYDTGLGPLRLDIATPASGDDAGEELFFYIGIGQAF
ncbi:MAG: autotransporter assembly complex protein TamA [Rhodosalinus sp.]